MQEKNANVEEWQFDSTQDNEEDADDFKTIIELKDELKDLY
jgi:hypothetical protein